jgi:hypothetical protein
MSVNDVGGQATLSLQPLNHFPVGSQHGHIALAIDRHVE